MAAVLALPNKSDLTTLDAVRAELGVETGHDELLGQLIARASAQVRTLCDRDFGLARTKQRVAGFPTTGLVYLNRFPVTEIHSVILDGRLLDDDQYGESDGCLHLTSGRWGRFGSLLVDYTGGYILPGEEGVNLPADIERATIMLVRRDFTDRSRDPALRSEAVEGIGTFTYFQSTMPSDVGALLDRYRVPVAL